MGTSEVSGMRETTFSVTYGLWKQVFRGMFSLTELQKHLLIEPTRQQEQSLKSREIEKCLSSFFFLLYSVLASPLFFSDKTIQVQFSLVATFYKGQGFQVAEFFTYSQLIFVLFLFLLRFSLLVSHTLSFLNATFSRQLSMYFNFVWFPYILLLLFPFLSFYFMVRLRCNTLIYCISISYFSFD